MRKISENHSCVTLIFPVTADEINDSLNSCKLVICSFTLESNESIFFIFLSRCNTICSTSSSVSGKGIGISPRVDVDRDESVTYSTIVCNRSIS